MSLLTKEELLNAAMNEWCLGEIRFIEVGDDPKEYMTTEMHVHKTQVEDLISLCRDVAEGREDIACIHAWHGCKILALCIYSPVIDTDLNDPPVHWLAFRKLEQTMTF